MSSRLLKGPRGVLVWASFLSLAAASGQTCGQDLQKIRERFPLHDTASLVTNPSQLARLLVPSAVTGGGILEASSERPRGPALTVYPLVAPATVVVRSGNGHGTGFVVDPAGWVLTNHHVVDDARLDPTTHAPMVLINFGRLNAEGFMELIEKPVPAAVHKVSPEKDLALLKVAAPAKGQPARPFVKLASAPAKPGSDCIAIGHPARGMAWTLRSGHVASTGTWPTDMLDEVMERLIRGKDRPMASRALAQLPKRKVLLSTCGLNPGDSGGPLVNAQGELIAVSFAVPSSDDRSVRLDKFSYHVHLDEVKAFLADRPATPLIPVPDPWPPATCCQLADTDDDGVPDTLAFGDAKRGRVTGLLLDLDQDSPLQNKKDLSPQRLREVWDFELALHTVPSLRVFYDTDNDGKVDLVLLPDEEQNKAVGSELYLHGGTWNVRAPQGKQLLDPSRFKDKKLQNRMRVLTRYIGP